MLSNIVIRSEAKDLCRNPHHQAILNPRSYCVSFRCKFNCADSPARSSGCAVYLGVIRLPNTACCVSKLP